MPELPEVETIVRELHRDLPGRRIEGLKIFRDSPLNGCPAEEFREKLLGRVFEGVSRRGKFLIFHLFPRRFLIGHLRMTGKFILSPSLEKPHPHHRVWFELDDASLLIFEDMRCFGLLAIADHLEDFPPLSRLGLEPLSPEFTGGWLAEALGASKSPLKNWLMDQSKIAGLGNIYVAEILFRAGLSPLRSTDSLHQKEADRLREVIREVLGEAIGKNGTTISDYRRVDDKAGEFQNFLRVYGKTGEPCPDCSTPIARIRQQQRSTFFCPTCQV